MSTPNASRGAKAPVNRLEDIVVEEVSLVDRAANKHRFLIVKRSEEMEETTTDTATTPPATEQPPGEAQNTSDTAAAPEDAPKGTATEPAEGTPLAVAVAALEGLTETVELLGTLGEQDASPRLTELATELRTVSEQLAQVGGAKGPTSADDGESKDDDRFATVIEAVRATLQRVGGLLEADDDDTTATPPASKDDDDDDDGSGSSGPTGLGAQLGALVTELRTLTDTVKEQQQRLARLEKRFGLPNSAPSGEQPPRPEPEDVGWPMDLNRPLGRESVDKAVSFHDV